MKNILCSAVIAAYVLAAGMAHAATTTAGVSVGRGDSHSMAYSLQVGQTYEPWLSNEACELAPTMELGGHAWVDDKDHVDTVWGMSLAPGLRFVLFTSSSFRPYLAGSVGGAVNSDDHLDDRDLGSNVLFRTKGTVGVDFGEGNKHHVQGNYTNYSTWGISDPDDGYNTYGMSYGYSF